MTKCYTFYSYKGGSGRSTTSINTVKHLIDELGACKDHPILLVDSDLESAGLTYFFECEKKFTGRMPFPLHTTHLFSAASSALKGDNGDRLFGTEDPDARSPVAKQRYIYETLANKYDRALVDSALEGLELLACEITNLKRIVECCVTGSTVSQHEKISKDYPISNLLNKLSKTKDAEEKRRIARNFLPAVGFVDISERFGAKEGTVKFLGADVHYEDSQLLKSDSAVEVIDELRLLCDEHGYAAIVFDSGAGVQSSADALQRASHVLVYCMRPTKQFRDGTLTQLKNYGQILQSTQKMNLENGDVKEKSKIVILLPTAVPLSAKHAKWAEDAFASIKNMANIYKDIVDGSFCTKDTCLNEVELFKWEEKILLSESGDPDTADEDRAYRTYQRLAQKMVEFTGKA